MARAPKSRKKDEIRDGKAGKVKTARTNWPGAGRPVAASDLEMARSAATAVTAAPLGIIIDLLPPGFHTRPGTRLVPTSLTIHNTDNPNRGAGAEAHNRYIRSPHAVAREVSWHFTVDDRSIYQHLPLNEVGWHAGRGNATSLGIEICMNSDMNVPAAYERAAELCAYLIVHLRLAYPGGLVQHHDWTGKNCPSVLRADRNRWPAFVNLVGQHLRRGPRPAPGPAAAVAAMAVAGDGGEEVLRSIDAHFAEHADAQAASVQALPIPQSNPVPFAASAAAVRYWPVVTRHPRALEVNTRIVGGGAVGNNPSRRFMANRQGSAGPRYHAAIDLYCSQGDAVVSVEDGKIVNFYPFYKGTNALLVKHGGYVVNYGEVSPNSLGALGLSIGSSVKAGQQIGTVGKLIMLHFETYVPGTTKNYSWLQKNPAPTKLRNPSQLLLDLAETGIRMDPDGAAMANVAALTAVSQAHTVSTSPAAFAVRAIPPMDQADWHRFGDGTREWSYDERGLWTRENGVVTKQLWDDDLDTMRQMMTLMGKELLAASEKHKIPPALLMMTVATETHAYKKHKFTGPKTFRWEAGVKNTDVNPPTKGDYSTGPMQPLGTTARWIITSKGKAFGLDYKPFAVAPVYKAKPSSPPAKHPLYDYASNTDIGSAVIRVRMGGAGGTGLDPIFVAAAHNTGDVYPSSHSPWGIKAYGDHLDRAAKWYGDACAYLVEAGVI